MVAPAPVLAERPRRWPGAAFLSHHRVRALLPTTLDIAVLGVIWLCFFWQLFVARSHLVPYDLIDQHYMFQVAVHRALDAGHLPWWSPSILSGYPLGADPLSATFYPPNLAMHLLTPGEWLPYIRLELQAALHIFWAALGTYALARVLAGSRVGALIAALTFAYGGFFAWHLPHLSPISSLSWLPWVLLGVYGASTRRNPAWLALGAASFGMLALAGHALTIVQVGYLVLGLVVAMTVVRWRAVGTDRWREAIQPLLAGAVILGVGLALAAVQLLPAWELGNQSTRDALAYSDATSSSFQPLWLATTILPDFFAVREPAQYWAGGDPAETGSYLGILPLALAAVAAVAARGRERGVVTLLITGGLALLVAMGSHTWLYRLAFDLLPGVDHVRRPVNALAIAHLAVALLAAFGARRLLEVGRAGELARERLQRWLGRAALGAVALVGIGALGAAAVNGQPSQPALRTIINGGVLLVVIVVLAWGLLRLVAAGSVSLGAAGLLLVALLAFDLGSAHAGTVYEQHERHPASYIGPDWAGNPSDQTVRLLQSLQAESDGGRIYVNRAGSIWENGPLVWSLDSAYGYSVLWPEPYQRLHDTATADPGNPLFNILGVRYLVLRDPIEAVYPQADVARFDLIHEGGGVRVYENPDALPRVWVAGTAVSVPADETLHWMSTNGAQLTNTVVLNEPVGDRTSAPGSASAGEVSWQRVDDATLVIDVRMAQAGWVVVSETPYPGWQAEIDGASAAITTVNLAQQAIWVEAGPHQVRLRYAPRQFMRGVVLSTLGVVALLVLMVLAGMHTRSTGTDATGRGSRALRRRQVRVMTGDRRVGPQRKIMLGPPEQPVMPEPGRLKSDA